MRECGGRAWGGAPRRTTLADAYLTNTRASVPEGASKATSALAARLEEAADARGSAWAEVFRKRELEMARVKARAERSDVVYS